MNGKFQSPESGAPRGPSELTIGLWMGVVLIGAKAALLGVPRSPQWLANLAIVTPYDVLFALAAGMLGAGAVRIAKRPGLRRLVRRVFIAFCVVCAFYSVVAVGVFGYFNRPLSFDLLRVVRSVGAVRSSISEQVTVPMAAALVGVPAVFCILVLTGRRRGAPKAIIGAATAWVGAGWMLAPSRPLAVSPKLILSPHVELARSMSTFLGGPPKLNFPEYFPPEDTQDFRSFAGRGGSSKAFFQPPGGVPRPRNVIFIVLESVSTKYLSLYGSRYNTTPNLAAEAAHALVFENCYSHASYTYHSFMAVNFSIYPGLPWCHAPWGGRPCPPALAAVLQGRGSRTAFLHNGDLDWGSMRWHVQGHGYGIAEDYKNFGCAPLTSWGTEDRCLFERLIRWIDEKPGQPFFALCWTDQTHDPYKLPAGFAEVDFFQGKPPPQLASELSRYLNILHETDRHLGRLFAALRERGLADDTLIVITGDHGEAFRDPHDHRGHGFTIYQEDVNVPLILWNPRLFSPGRRMAEVCAHVDVNPTIADVLGLTPPGGWQGYSLFDLTRPARAYFLTGTGEYFFGMREGPWKYLFEATGGKERLFDLRRDPEELHSVAAAEPELCQRMRQRLAAFVSFEEAFLRGHGD